MATTVADFRTRFPEFQDPDEYPTARIEMFLGDTEDYIGTNENHWKGKYDRAQAYLAAHLLHTSTLMEAGDVNARAGQVQSKSAGGVSVSKALAPRDLSLLDEWYMSTAYGQQYIQIRNLTFVGSTVAKC